MNYRHQPVTHVLFDMDGLILDTEQLYTQAFQTIVAKFGQDYTFDLKMKLMGLQAQETAKVIVRELNLPITPEEFQAECKTEFTKLFPESRVLPGVQRLIEHFHKHNVPMGLATSSHQESYQLKVNRHHEDLFELFQYKTFGSSDPAVKRGKPDPDIFIVAASKFPDNPSHNQILVFEDAVNGVKAARAAGMQVVMVPDPRVPEELTKEATLVLRTMEEFKPELFGLPPLPSDIKD